MMLRVLAPPLMGCHMFDDNGNDANLTDALVLPTMPFQYTPLQLLSADDVLAVVLDMCAAAQIKPKAGLARRRFSQKMRDQI